MKKYTTGIVTTNWGSDSYTINFLKTLGKSKNKDFFTVVVNNDPNDNKILNNLVLDPTQKLINTNYNLGYSGGINRGIEFLNNNIEYEYLLIINNDVEFEDGFLEKLSSNCGSNEIVSPVILYANTQTIQTSGGRISYLLGGTINLNKNRLYEKLVKRVPDYLSGCCLMARKEVLRKLGYFDEDYGSYYEDVDLCTRAKALGIKMKVIWDLKLFHFHSASTRNISGFKIQLIARNSILYARKNLKFPLKNIFIIFGIFRGFIQYFIKPKVIKNYVLGVKEGLSIKFFTNKNHTVSK